MGAVYHAELRVPGGFRRPCAVKVILDGGPDRDHFVARMRDEARLLGMLQDEQILGVSELVMVAGRDAVIMEYVDGVDLSDIVSKGPIPPRALAELGAEMAGSLYRAHSAKHPTTQEPLNVIHRDIKPANVMVTTRGSVRLLDFGVARAAFASRESETQGLVLGTLNYFPPEILAGGDPSTAVDIYGLGISLWECAMGENWGSPRVKQDRFEERVDQRLKALPPGYKDIVPVLEQTLQWDPRLRPDGGVVERSLLHAADHSTGEGLRTWARTMVPELLAEKRQNAQVDDWVGLTLQVSAYGEEPEQTHYRPVPEALREDLGNDIPDPAATFAASKMADAAMGQKEEWEPELSLPQALPPKVEPASQKKVSKKRGQSSSKVLAALLGVLFGLIVLCLLAILLLIVVIAVLLFG